MTTAQTLWAVCGIAAFLLLPVGAFRMLAYLSGEVDHTPAMRAVARMALVVGGVALAAFLGLTAWLLATDQRPW
ncbi:MAG TPA: hypothetical protein VFR87_08435 [Nocardioidaceae bacterium]|nr:hypothetical protein [Nocardioidaceae bacterium]